MKRFSRLATAAFCTFATATTAAAHEFKLGDLVIDHPMAFETAKTAMSGGGFFAITNNGSTADRLLEVRAGFPSVQLHNTEMTDDVARMFHVEAVDIPAGETVQLAPGGLHVMFMGLGGDPFEVGETFPATLVFEKAGEVEVVFYVEERTAEAMDHSGHQMGN
ncbi:MAG: copper chaperone PCu(A)C [Yoonia sp.]|uniref:copper chaperone PCu(A)C n=1 Tax=Yoonia sp. TaxID=2212373 RepID=UPI00273F4232|nr:copper chaperone PCu(A)C [Yoonia sp.]MDP5086910.1 copper chaperone PCu(A)C [Yoonia sp.]